MSLRCPSSKYVGLGVLKGWRWIINERGYANVVSTSPAASNRIFEPHSMANPPPTQSALLQSSSGNSGGERRDGGGEDEDEGDDDYSTQVYGLVYSLTSDDEASLDVNEGVPTVYSKEVHSVRLWPDTSAEEATSDKKQDMLVYVSHRYTTEGKAREEYVYRMNKAIEDALDQGMPQGYVSDVLRKWIPSSTGKEGTGEGEGGLRWKAESQAARFEEGIVEDWEGGGEGESDDCNKEKGRGIGWGN